MELLLASCYGDCAGLDVTDVLKRSLSPAIRKYRKPWEAFGGSTFYLIFGTLQEIVTHSSRLLLLTVS